MLNKIKTELARRSMDPLHSDMVIGVDGVVVEAPPFWAVRAGNNRIQRVTKMLELGFISHAEAQAFLGAT